jgi:hypothetical protein
MHDMVSWKERTVSAKNGILDIMGSNYRKSLEGVLSSDKIHIVSWRCQCISQCLYICANLPRRKRFTNLCTVPRTYFQDFNNSHDKHSLFLYTTLIDWFLIWK